MYVHFSETIRADFCPQAATIYNGGCSVTGGSWNWWEARSSSKNHIGKLSCMSCLNDEMQQELSYYLRIAKLCHRRTLLQVVRQDESLL